MKKIENNEQGNARYQFEGKLLAPISETILQNSNGKKYRIATISFINRKGQEVRSSAAIYEGNYSKTELVVGEKYLCTATIAPDKEGKLVPYIQMSHLLAGADRADIDDFVDAVEEVSVYMGSGEINS